jgi:hypothetical protein
METFVDKHQETADVKLEMLKNLSKTPKKKQISKTSTIWFYLKKVHGGENPVVAIPALKQYGNKGAVVRCWTEGGRYWLAQLLKSLSESQWRIFFYSPIAMHFSKIGFCNKKDTPTTQSFLLGNNTGKKKCAVVGCLEEG